jgi:glutaredoxin
MSGQNQAQVIVYGTSWCAFCHAETQWLNQLGIPYTKKNIETDNTALEELLKKTGGEQNVPITDIGGDIIVGFDRPKILVALKARGIYTSDS